MKVFKNILFVSVLFSFELVIKPMQSYALFSFFKKDQDTNPTPNGLEVKNELLEMKKNLRHIEQRLDQNLILQQQLSSKPKDHPDFQGVCDCSLKHCTPQTIKPRSTVALSDHESDSLVERLPAYDPPRVIPGLRPGMPAARPQTHTDPGSTGPAQLLRTTQPAALLVPTVPSNHASNTSNPVVTDSVSSSARCIHYYQSQSPLTSQCSSAVERCGDVQYLKRKAGLSKTQKELEKEIAQLKSDIQLKELDLDDLRTTCPDCFSLANSEKSKSSNKAAFIGLAALVPLLMGGMDLGGDVLKMDHYDANYQKFLDQGSKELSALLQQNGQQLDSYNKNYQDYLSQCLAAGIPCNPPSPNAGNVVTPIGLTPPAGYSSQTAISGNSGGYSYSSSGGFGGAAAGGAIPGLAPPTAASTESSGIFSGIINPFLNGLLP